MTAARRPGLGILLGVLIAFNVPCLARAQSAPVQWSGIDRVVAFADVHGAYAELLPLLRETGIVDAEEKMRTVERVCLELGVPPSRAIVMGDGANDLRMMKVSGLSVAFRAKPVVRAQADVALNFSGLDGVLAVLA